MCGIEISKKSLEIKVHEESAKDIENNQEYRYLLIKKWGKEDNIATVIMFNPSRASCLMYDKTVMNVENYLKIKKFNNVRILNLYAIMGENSNIIKNSNEKFERENDKYIDKYIKDANKIFLAWGYGKENNGSEKVKDRIKKVTEMVKAYAITHDIPVHGFIDDNEQNRMHPQNMNIYTWGDKVYWEK